MTLGVDRGTGEPLDGLAHVKQSVADILTTRKGSRVMRREYGSDLPNLVDNPMTPGFSVDLYAATAEALDLWEPRLRLISIEVAAATPGKVTLNLVALYMPDMEEIRIDGLIIG